jgi:ribosomal protein S11
MNNLLIVHIKILRNNYYVILSNTLGKILYTKSCGIYNFKNIQKRNIESFKIIILDIFKYISQENFNNKIFFKIDGSKKNILREIYKQIFFFINKYKIKILGLIITNKIAFNGCRKKIIK